MSFLSGLRNAFQSARQSVQNLWARSEMSSIFSSAVAEPVSQGPRLFDPSFMSANFDRRVGDALHSARIFNAESVSGVFRFSQEQAEHLQRTLNFQGNFLEATIVVAHSDDGQAAAYMVGRRQGTRQYEVISLQNIARPHDRSFVSPETAQGSVDYFKNIADLYATPVREYASLTYAARTDMDIIRLAGQRRETINYNGIRINV